MCVDSFMGNTPQEKLGSMVLLGGLGETLVSGISTFTASRAKQKELQARADVALHNANLRKLELKDIDRRKRNTTTQVERQTERLLRTKRAKRSGGSLDVNYGAPLEDMLATELFGIADKGTIAINAEKEKIGVREGVRNALLEAEFAKEGADAQQPLLSTAGTLAAGATKVAGKWYRTQQLLKLGNVIPTRLSR